MEQAMANYQEKFEIFGLGPYPADHYRPYGRKLTGAQKEALTAELDTNFYQTSREICAFVMEESGGGYRPGGLMPLLHKLGFSHKKTNTIPCGADGRPRQGLGAVGAFAGRFDRKRRSIYGCSPPTAQYEQCP